MRSCQRKSTAGVENKIHHFTKLHLLSMSDYQTIHCSTAGSVLTITLNRPEAYNAMNEQMKRELNDALKAAERDTSVRCLVIRGAGEKAFCSGQDLKEHAGSTERRSLKKSLETMYNPMIRRIRTTEKPVIGMINGVAAGAGMSIALACDLRIMAESAKFVTAFSRIALIPDSGMNWILPRLVGLARAFEYLTLSNEISAQEAQRAGLVNKVVPSSELERATNEIAIRLAAGPTRTYGLIKRTLNRALTSDLDSLLEYEAMMQEIASLSEDHAEGIRAFLEKRSATFKGK
jgi:2-(1,2-epoxy-1,2-dihydrophenyl)acetyl-CoA isomerase